jgi:hypothetical protein
MGILSPFVGHSSFHIRNSGTFIQKLSAVYLQETDILVSFEILSLFTKVSLEDTPWLLIQHFHDWTISLFKQVLTTTYFLYGTFSTTKQMVSPWD